MRRFIIIWLITLLGVVGAAVAEEPDANQQFTLTCEPGQATVFIGDHHIGMSHMRINHEDPWLEIVLRQGDTIINLDDDVTFFEVWVDLDGDEVDLGASCTATTTTTTTSSTTTTPTTTTTTSTTTTKPSSTTTTHPPPTTTTTTSLPYSDNKEPTDPLATSCTVCLCQCCPINNGGIPQPPPPPNPWVWPVTLGWFGLLATTLTGLLIRARYLIGPSAH